MSNKESKKGMTKLEIDLIDQMKLKVMNKINEEHQRSGRTQEETAKLLDVNQPKISDISNLKVDKFSLERLIVLADRLNIKFDVS